MPGGDREGRGIAATETTFAIVETLYGRGQLRLVEIADRVGIANSTASEHLATLCERGYVVADADGYRLGLKFLDRGVRAKDHYVELSRAAGPVLEGLAADTAEVVNLVVEEHGRAVYLRRLVGDRGVPTNSWEGQRKPIHTLSAGKAILAHLPAERIDAIVDRHGLSGPTDATVTDRTALERELERIRKDGIARNDRESHEQIRAVGAPILRDGTVRGAVSIAGPAGRLVGESFERTLPGLLRGAVDEIELTLAYG